MKTYKQTDWTKPAPMTPAERQAKRKAKLIRDSQELMKYQEEIKSDIALYKALLKSNIAQKNYEETLKSQGALNALMNIAVRFKIEWE